MRCRYTVLVTFFLLVNPVHSWQQIPSRRRFMERLLFVSSGLTTSSLLPDSSYAIQGAAEYDLEYYLRDLFQGNPKQGTKAASQIPQAPAPRTLTGPLQPLLLSDDLLECVPVKVLCHLLAADKTQSSSSSSSSIIIIDRVKSIRNAASRSFQSRAPWNYAIMSDQYYFDITSYALWKTAAELLPDYKVRDDFVRIVGRELYSNSSLFRTRPSWNNVVTAPLTTTMSSMKEILDLFTASQYCSGYKVASDKDDNTAFDKLDDIDLLEGVSVNCLVSIYSPATLGASLQITGEQSRFIPDFVATTLAAMWESAGIGVSYETYFVDPEYRPNPKDYFPDEQLLQFTLTIKS